jgi:hypothetical protein
MSETCDCKKRDALEELEHFFLHISGLRTSMLAFIVRLFNSLHANYEVIFEDSF